MPLNPQNPRFPTPFHPLWCQSVKVKVSNCISAYVDMRHFIWLIIIYNLLLFLLPLLTISNQTTLSIKKLSKTILPLIKCQSEFDTLTLTLWHLILFYPYQYHDFNKSTYPYAPPEIKPNGGRRYRRYSLP